MQHRLKTQNALTSAHRHACTYTLTLTHDWHRHSCNTDTRGTFSASGICWTWFSARGKTKCCNECVNIALNTRLMPKLRLYTWLCVSTQHRLKTQHTKDIALKTRLMSKLRLYTWLCVSTQHRPKTQHTQDIALKPVWCPSWGCRRDCVFHKVVAGTANPADLPSSQVLVSELLRAN